MTSTYECIKRAFTFLREINFFPGGMFRRNIALEIFSEEMFNRYTGFVILGISGAAIAGVWGYLSRKKHLPLKDVLKTSDAFKKLQARLPEKKLKLREVKALKTGHISVKWPDEIIEYPKGLFLDYPKRLSLHMGILEQGTKGIDNIVSNKNCPDTTFVSSLPLFSPELNKEMGNAFGLGASRVGIYFEVTITELGPPHIARLAIGFTCLPYPSWSLPGWHCGSFAVHGNNGNLFVNDSGTGKPFMSPFKRGETIGIGYNLDRMVCYGTRNGNYEVEWNLSGDAIDQEQHYFCGLAVCGGEMIDGLEGNKNIHGAVGVTGGVGVVINWTGKNYPFRFN